MSRSLRLSLYLATRGQGPRGGVREGAEAEERQGRSRETRPDGPLIWMHTGSDREARAARELVGRIRSERPDINYLFTTDASERPESDGPIQSVAVPDERLGPVRRFLEHWRPDLGVWTQADLRPALISSAEERGIPLLMVEAAGHAARPTQTWSRGLSTDVLNRFRQIVAGDARSATALRQMGAASQRIETAGFLQEGTPAPPCNEAERDDLAALMAARPAWLAASVTQDELTAVVEAHRIALRRAHRLLLILVPDEMEAGPDWAARLAALGYPVALRSQGDEPEPETQVYLADTEGEMGLWYRLAPISFLGGSLGSPGGGINPYEAASLGSAIIHGPNVRDHRAAFDRLLAAGAARPVRTAQTLGEAVEALLSPARAAAMARQGWEVTSAGAAVTDRVIDLILSEIEAL